MTRNPEFEPPDVCPVCGADVPRRATACPGCGSDETSGWSEQARYDALDLPDRDFDYAEYANREFGGSPRRGRRQWFWWGTAVVVTGLFVWLVLRGFWGR